MAGEAVGVGLGVAVGGLVGCRGAEVFAVVVPGADRAGADVRGAIVADRVAFGVFWFDSDDFGTELGVFVGFGCESDPIGFVLPVERAKVAHPTTIAAAMPTEMSSQGVPPGGSSRVG